ADLRWRTVGRLERESHGIQDTVLGRAYHLLRQVAIRQLQRIVAEMIDDSVVHFLGASRFPLKAYSPQRRRVLSILSILSSPRPQCLCGELHASHYITRTDRLSQTRRESSVGDV